MGGVVLSAKNDTSEAGEERRKTATSAGWCFNCTDAYPRGIKVTKAIQEVKPAVLFRSF